MWSSEDRYTAASLRGARHTFLAEVKQQCLLSHLRSHMKMADDRETREAYIKEQDTLPLG